MTSRQLRLKKHILAVVAAYGPMTRDEIYEALLTRCPPSFMPSKKNLASLLPHIPGIRRVGGETFAIYDVPGAGL